MTRNHHHQKDRASISFSLVVHTPIPQQQSSLLLQPREEANEDKDACAMYLVAAVRGRRVARARVGTTDAYDASDDDRVAHEHVW